MFCKLDFVSLFLAPYYAFRTPVLASVLRAASWHKLWYWPNLHDWPTGRRAASGIKRWLPRKHENGAKRSPF